MDILCIGILCLKGARRYLRKPLIGRRRREEPANRSDDSDGDDVSDDDINNDIDGGQILQKSKKLKKRKADGKPVVSQTKHKNNCTFFTPVTGNGYTDFDDRVTFSFPYRRSEMTNGLTDKTRFSRSAHKQGALHQSPWLD